MSEGQYFLGGTLLNYVFSGPKILGWVIDKAHFLNLGNMH